MHMTRHLVQCRICFSILLSSQLKTIQGGCPLPSFTVVVSALCLCSPVESRRPQPAASSFFSLEVMQWCSVKVVVYKILARLEKSVWTATHAGAQQLRTCVFSRFELDRNRYLSPAHSPSQQATIQYNVLVTCRSEWWRSWAISLLGGSGRATPTPTGRYILLDSV